MSGIYLVAHIIMKKQAALFDSFCVCLLKLNEVSKF